MAKQEPPVKLHKGEKVMLSFQRSKVNLVITWICAGVVVLALIAGAVALKRWAPESGPLNFGNLAPLKTLLSFACLIALPVVLIAALVTTHVDRKNVMFVTNQRIIQRTSTSLFSYSVNTIEFRNVEDVSYKQDDFIAHLFHYGTLRVSTEGDETTYTFPFLHTPIDEMETISQLVADAHKNGDEKK